jgi:hypothetical protein
MEVTVCESRMGSVWMSGVPRREEMAEGKVISVSVT